MKMACKITEINYMALVVSLLHNLVCPFRNYIFDIKFFCCDYLSRFWHNQNEVMPPPNVFHLMPGDPLSYFEGKTFVLYIGTLVGLLLLLFPFFKLYFN